MPVGMCEQSGVEIEAQKLRRLGGRTTRAGGGGNGDASGRLAQAGGSGGAGERGVIDRR